MQPSDSSYLPIRFRLLTFPNRPGIAVATAGGMRSPRFRRVPFERNGVFDHGRAVAPRMTVRNMLPSTFSTVSAPAGLYLSRLNSPLHSIAVYASPWSSPSTPQHSLPGDPLRSYPGRTSTGGNAPASPGAPKIYPNDVLFGPISVRFQGCSAPDRRIWRVNMAYKPICTPCFRPGFHIARRKQASHPGGRNGVQYANARLSGLVIHQSHRCIEMACNALEYIFGAPGEAGAFPPVEVRPG